MYLIYSLIKRNLKHQTQRHRNTLTWSLNSLILSTDFVGTSTTLHDIDPTVVYLFNVNRILKKKWVLKHCKLLKKLSFTKILTLSL